MDRVPVKSSNVSSVGYDPAEKQMEVEFKSGAVYRYDEVDYDTFRALLNSPSVGSHFHRHIKGNYDYKLVVPAPKKETEHGQEDDSKAVQSEEVKE